MASLHILRRSLRHPHNPSRAFFSTTTTHQASLQWDRNNPESLSSHLPPYPYGPTRWYKQSRLGLYGSARLQFGNNVSGRFETKTRRRWHVNVKQKRLFSKALNRNVQVRVSTRVLRTIDKLGGLDEYLLGEKEGRVRELGESGWWLRWAVMQSASVRGRFRREREMLGLPVEEAEVRVQEEDAEATLAAGVPDAEVAELTAAENAELDAEIESGVSEEIALDDAFQVEEAKDLPPLRFRVGPGQFVMLTENGWRRVIRPDAAKKGADHIKASIAKRMPFQPKLDQLDQLIANEMKDVSISYTPPPPQVAAEGQSTEQATAEDIIPKASDAPIAAAETAETAPSSLDPTAEGSADSEATALQPITRLLTPAEKADIRKSVVRKLQSEHRALLKREFEAVVARKQAKKAERKAVRHERRVERSLGLEQEGAVA